jgi:aryl-alcohol dehydrogenase-like predicted oxidoreductase
MRPSPLGFGTYRWTGTPAETAALRHALDLGCRLVDTAPNYSPAELRHRLGDALCGYRDEVFVISKAGYRADSHCLEPAFLREQMESEARLVGHGHLDGFLLHNPEHLLSALGRTALMHKIAEAFACCEQWVRAGTISCYGISSNVIAAPDHPFGQPSVDELIAIACDIDADHHFRLLQFPFNLGERDALTNSWARRCREHGLTTFGNRPLSVRTDNGPIRLADSPARPARPSAEILREFSDALRTVWAHVASSDALDYLTSCLTKAGVPLEDLTELVAATRAELRENAARRCAPLIAKAVREGHLPGPDTDPIPLRACRSYLNVTDHILVGLRSAADVATLAELFHHNPNRPTKAG